MMYEAGDRVKIVDEWPPQPTNHCQKMDHWLGQIMTIRLVDQFSMYDTAEYWMEEDIKEYRGNRRPGWVWNEAWIEGLADEYNDVSETDFMNMLGDE